MCLLTYTINTMYRKWKPDINKLGKNLYKGYKLLSYNILAQDLLVEHPFLYQGIDNKMLGWNSRLNKLQEEITAIEPDILCLQEMQYNHVKELVNVLSITPKHKGLEYVFKKKTGNRSDGCVIIYDRNKFKLISECFVEYYTENVPTLNRENIGIMIKLKTIDDNSATFVVATTHLLYNPRREDVRISQMNKFIEAIIKFSEISGLRTCTNRTPVILTGDFNFTPNTRAFETLVALRRNFFQMDAIDFGMVDGASTYQGQWKTVDYILKSRSNGEEKSIHVKSTYKLPSIDQCWKNGKIPNNVLGSDHFSLAIEFSVL